MFVLFCLLISVNSALTSTSLNVGKDYFNQFFKRRTQHNSNGLSSNRSVKAVTCVTDCLFELPFGYSLTIPSNCKTTAVDAMCAVSISINHESKTIEYNFFKMDQTNDLGITEVEILAVNSLFSPLSSILTNWIYTCNSENDCNKRGALKYMSNNTFGEKDLTLHSQLSKLIYNHQNLSSVQQCFTDSSNLNDCANGVCVYKQEGTESPIDTYECDQLNYPVDVAYVGGQASPADPVEQIPIIWTFRCNLNQCNSPSNVAAVRRTIETSDHWNLKSHADRKLFNLSGALIILLNLFLTFTYLRRN